MSQALALAGRAAHSGRERVEFTHPVCGATVAATNDRFDGSEVQRRDADAFVSSTRGGWAVREGEGGDERSPARRDAQMCGRPMDFPQFGFDPGMHLRIGGRRAFAGRRPPSCGTSAAVETCRRM